MPGAGRTCRASRTTPSPSRCDLIRPQCSSDSSRPELACVARVGNPPHDCPAGGRSSTRPQVGNMRQRRLSVCAPPREVHALPDGRPKLQIEAPREPVVSLAAEVTRRSRLASNATPSAFLRRQRPTCCRHLADRTSRVQRRRQWLRQDAGSTLSLNRPSVAQVSGLPHRRLPIGRPGTVVPAAGWRPTTPRRGIRTCGQRG